MLDYQNKIEESLHTARIIKQPQTNQRISVWGFKNLHQSDFLIVMSSMLIHFVVFAELLVLSEGGEQPETFWSLDYPILPFKVPAPILILGSPFQCPRPAYWPQFSISSLFIVNHDDFLGVESFPGLSYIQILCQEKPLYYPRTIGLVCTSFFSFLHPFVHYLQISNQRTIL